MLPKFFLYFLIVFFIPNPVKAQGLVPCGSAGQDPCTFSDIMILISNVLDFFFMIAIPIAAVVFVYAGFLLLTAGGSSEKRGQAKKIFINVVIGLVLLFAAWLIVDTIVSALGFESIEGIEFMG